MFLRQVEQINKDLKRTKKAIIALGCSFVQGQGALGDHIYNTYNWHAEPDSPFVDVGWKFNKKDLRRIKEEYPLIDTFDRFKVSFVYLEYQNAFVNILARKYFQDEYTPINLGLAGRGNRATIKELHYYPSLAWKDIEECIVIYCPSGAERFDFIDDQNLGPNEHTRWTSIWPNQLPDDLGPKSKLWSGYQTSIYSEKFEVLEQIAHIQELLLWCKLKNSKLLITPAFQRTYSQLHFTDALKQVIGRHAVTGEILNRNTAPIIKDISQSLQMWPWRNMFHPGGYETFMDLVMAQEFPDSYKNQWFYEFVHKGTPNLWVTPCCHPNAKGHDLFARYLHEEITNNLDQYTVNYR